MMEFNELYETLLNAAKGHDSFTLNMVKTSKETYRAIYEHGAASRQAEIDELQNKLDDIVDLVCNNTPDYRIDDMIQEILKGKENEN